MSFLLGALATLGKAAASKVAQNVMDPQQQQNGGAMSLGDILGPFRKQPNPYAPSQNPMDTRLPQSGSQNLGMLQPIQPATQPLGQPQTSALMPQNNPYRRVNGAPVQT